MTKEISQLPDNPLVEDTDRYGADKIGGETVNSSHAQIKADIVNTLLGLGGEQVGSLHWGGQFNLEFFGQLSDGLTEFEKADFPELILNNSPNDGNWEALYGSQSWFIGSDAGKFRLPPAALAGLFLRATSSTFGHSLGDLTPNKTKAPVIPFTATGGDHIHTGVSNPHHHQTIRDVSISTADDEALSANKPAVREKTNVSQIDSEYGLVSEAASSADATVGKSSTVSPSLTIDPSGDLNMLFTGGGDNETASQALTQNLFVLMKPKLAFAPPPAGVSSFNSRLGAVLPILGDYHGEILTISSGDGTLIKDYIDTMNADSYLLDGTNALTAPIDMQTFKINNMADPTLAQDAATKAYVDGIFSARNVIVLVNSTANIPITDGFATAPIIGFDAAPVDSQGTDLVYDAINMITNNKTTRYNVQLMANGIQVGGGGIGQLGVILVVNGLDARRQIKSVTDDVEVTFNFNRIDVPLASATTIQVKLYESGDGDMEVNTTTEGLVTTNALTLIMSEIL